MDWSKLFIENNVGKTDRTVRIAVGLVLFILAIVLQIGQIPRTVLGLVGVVGIATGIMGHCVIYSLFGWNTLKK